MQLVILNDKNHHRVVEFLGLTLAEEVLYIWPVLERPGEPVIELDTIIKRRDAKRERDKVFAK